MSKPRVITYMLNFTPISRKHPAGHLLIALDRRVAYRLDTSIVVMCTCGERRVLR